MKAMNRFFAGITLTLTMMGSGVAWGDSSVVGGNVIVDRPVVDSSTSNFYMVDTNHPLNADGSVDQWEIFAGAQTPVQLVIFRQRGGQFFVVGKSSVVEPTTTGYNLFELNPKLKVKAGDFVGAYFPDTGSIVFNDDPPYPPPSTFSAGDLTGTTLLLLIGTTTTPSPDPPYPIAFTLSSNRHYSIRVMGNCQINIANAKANPNVLWPPNNKMVSVTVTVSASSSCDTTLACAIQSVTGNEPLSAGDWQITNPPSLTVNLRATRAGNGIGRVYTLTGECTDTSGNIAPLSTTVTVPHDQGK
ncbi:MAG: hypothetical protein V9G98_08785 [Candidatus Competibacter sp.]